MASSFYADRISDHLGETPEGFLVCLGARLCRSGDQRYHASELGLSDNGYVDVYRPPHEVLSKKFIASLNGKPVTDGHPPTFVNASTHNWVAKGHVQNPRAGGQLENGDSVVVGDLVVTDPALAAKIRSGVMREVSLGYEYELVPTDDRFEMRNLRGNHAAIVHTGRAGPEIKIQDAIYRENFAEIVRRFLGRNPAAVTTELHRGTTDGQNIGEPMTRKKLKQLQELLGELLRDERRAFAKDTGLTIDDGEYASLMRPYLGRELPRLGEVRNDDVARIQSRRHAKDANDVAQDFEANCRALRLKLQRG